MMAREDNISNHTEEGCMLDARTYTEDLGPDEGSVPSSHRNLRNGFRASPCTEQS